MQKREQILNNWLTQILPHPYALRLLAGDASFRRYFRLHAPDQTFVVMDAPPEKETLHAFLSVQAQLTDAGICVPACLEQNLEQGFLLLSDFGDRLLLDALTQANHQQSYAQSLTLLAQLQQLRSSHLPAFDQPYIQLELSYFKDWFLKTYLKLTLNEQEEKMLADAFTQLSQQLMHQPQVFMHRDYHSRNIMCLTNNTLGLLDFQDAMQGPIGYDLASLLKDCYIEQSADHFHHWVVYYHTHHLAQTVPDLDCATLTHFIELCGLQRHLKVLGIFARLACRDQKTHYLQHLPLALRYISTYLKDKPDFKALYQFIQHRVQLP